MKKVALLLAGLALALPAQADLHGNIKYLQAIEKKSTLCSYPETNLFYTAGKIDGYTYLDVYNVDVYSDGSYYGRTSLTRELVPYLCAKVEGEHDSKPLTDAGVGVTGKYAYGTGDASMSLMPYYLGEHGHVGKKVLLQFTYDQRLPFGFAFSTFGEWNVKTKQWGYGEAELSRRFGMLGVGINAALLNKANLVPDKELRAVLSLNF
ncbi:MAG: hypothetical protein V1725_03215 [archaeon]